MKREEKIALKKTQTGIDEKMIDQLVRTFYEKIGFEYFSKTKDKDEEIIMVYYDSAINKIDFYASKVICRVEIQPAAFKIFNTLKLEKEIEKLK